MNILKKLEKPAFDWKMIFLLFFVSTAHAQTLIDGSMVPTNESNTIQIRTEFNDIVGRPSWLLVLRDDETKQVIPYLFDLRNETNFWVAFSAHHSYHITVSQMKFSAYAKIDNFCGLENSFLKGVSMNIVIKGVLSPDANMSDCYISRYHFGLPFFIFQDNHPL